MKKIAVLNAKRIYKLLDSIVLLMLLGHIAFVFLFWFLERYEIALINLFISVPTLSVSLVFIRKRILPRLRIILPYTELILHSILASIFLGWETGFYMYLVAGIVLTQLYPWSTKLKFGIGGILVVVIALLYMLFHEGRNEFNSSTTQLIFLLNLSSVVIYMTYFLFFQIKLSNELESEITVINSSLEHQKKAIEEAHNEIQNSIFYSKRIQTALLPSKEQIVSLFPNCTFIYEPRDIIAGDFYWSTAIGSKKYLAIADCTGHGVPGAMVSLVCINALKKSVTELNKVMPGEILTETRNIIVSELNDISDGMDIVLIVIEEDNLYFAGAHNSIYIKRGTELFELKGDKQPVGKYISTNDFTTHHFQLEKNDILFLITDGIIDQFGGPKGKKFKSSQFKELILSQPESRILEEIIGEIHTTYVNWKGELEQLDDVTVFGLKV